MRLFILCVAAELLAGVVVGVELRQLPYQATFPGEVLELSSRRDKSSGRLQYESWCSPKFDAAQCRRLNVDFQLTTESSGTFAPVVRDATGRALLVPVFSYGELQILLPERSRRIGKLDFSHPNDFRYAIDVHNNRFDLYINDFSRPVARDLRFRFPHIALPAQLWLEGNSREPVPTRLGRVRVTPEELIADLPENWAQPPYFVAPVRKIDTAEPGDADFAQVPEYALMSANKAPTAPAKFRMLWSDTALYVRITGRDSTVPTPSRSDNVYLTDNFQLFIDPGRSGIAYAHITFNRVGSCVEAWVNDVRRDRTWKSRAEVRLLNRDGEWGAAIRIPFAALGKKPIPGEIWGFNCGRENPLPGGTEVSAWRPLQKFNSPELFGRVMFFDQRSRFISCRAASAVLNDKCFELAGQLASAVAVTRQLRQIPALERVTDRLDKKLEAIRREIAAEPLFPTAWRLNGECASLLTEARRQLRSVEYARTLFAPGSDNALRGFAASVETPLVRVKRDFHSASGETRSSLELAGGEAGGFLVVLTARPPEKIRTVKLAWTPFRDERGKDVPALLLQSFRADFITSARMLAPQTSVADALIPGREFTLKSPVMHQPCYFEVLLPRSVAPGRYRSEVTVTADGRTPAVIPVEVTALPFKLPVRSSLLTAFAFHEPWAETYYGRRLSRREKQAWRQFMLDHRLQPVDLWSRRPDTDAELEFGLDRGQTLSIVRSVNADRAQLSQRLKKYAGRLRFYYFNYDEVLSQEPAMLPRMKHAYAEVKAEFPTLTRLSTAPIDGRLYGSVDAWCSLVDHFDAKRAGERAALGEEIWWYFTCYPEAPYPNLNLDSAPLDARIIPWMNWKFKIAGLLYWGINHDWVTQVSAFTTMTDRERTARNLDWITPELLRLGEKRPRWPEIPWIPFISKEPGGGNFMYPGADGTPWPSLKLKALRDGLQDYEYFVLLRRNVEALKKRFPRHPLIAPAEAALCIAPGVVGGKTAYTHDPVTLLAARHELAELIVATGKALR